MQQYTQIEGLPGVYSTHKGNLRSIAIILKDRSWCVISPIAGLPKTAYASLEAIANVKHVLAPNRYHNKGIAEFSKTHPGAVFYSSSAAAERLQKQTGAHFNSLELLRKQLKRGFSFLEPAGLKTGEIWIRSRFSKLTAWMVVDAFCGPKLAKQASEAATPELLKTFPNYGIDNKSEYCSWAETQIRNDNPTLLIPCHGRIVRSAGLSKSLSNIITAL